MVVDNRTPSQKNNGKEETSEKDNSHERDMSLNKNCRDKVPSRNNPVDNRYLSKEPYTKVFSITLSTKNGKGSICYTLTVFCICSTNADFDVDAIPKLSCCDKPLFTRVLPSIRPYDSSWLNSATEQKVRVVGTIVLHDQIGESGIILTFGMVRSLAALSSLLLSYCGFIRGIFPIEKKIVSFNSPPVPFFVTWNRIEQQRRIARINRR